MEQSSDPQSFIFFGRSGSGKGTQAKLLVDRLKERTGREVLYVETGEKFREFAKEEGLASLLVKDIMDRGGLIPEFLPIWIWTNFLITHFTGNEHLVLDGLSRRVDEAPVLASALKFYGFKNPRVVYLNLSRQSAFDRMKGRGRSDDTDEYINSRLDWFDTSVMPAIDYFRKNDYFTFLDVDAEGSIEEVHDLLMRRIGETGK